MYDVVFEKFMPRVEFSKKVAKQLYENIICFKKKLDEKIDYEDDELFFNMGKQKIHTLASIKDYVTNYRLYQIEDELLPYYEPYEPMEVIFVRSVINILKAIKLNKEKIYLILVDVISLREWKEKDDNYYHMKYYYVVNLNERDETYYARPQLILKINLKNGDIKWI